MMVLIDTSAWIESFRTEGDASLTAAVADLVADGTSAVVGMVKLELLRGALPHEASRLAGLLNSVPCLETREAEFDTAGRLGADLRRNGLRVPSTDLLIAVLSLAHDVSLLHCDRHFDLMVEAGIPLRFWSV